MSETSIATETKVTPKKQPKVLKPVVAKDDRIQPIGDGETANRGVVHVGKMQAKVAYSVKHNKDDKTRYQMNRVFDFRGCSDEELLELAISSAVIMEQSRWRKLPDNERLSIRENTTPIDVKHDLLSRQRQVAGGKTGAMRKLMREGNISEEEAIALLIERINSKNGATQ